MVESASSCNCPASQRACTRPRSESGTSLCPQKRCCVFHSVSPCRTSHKRLELCPSPLFAVVALVFASTMNRFFSYPATSHRSGDWLTMEQPAVDKLDSYDLAGIECIMRWTRVNGTSRP